MIGAAIAGVLAFALALRAVPVLLAPHGAGIDHWYWKTYVDTYRRTGRFPPELPQYVLEEHQWYPPLFGVVLSWLPSTVFGRFDTLIAIGIDLLRLLVLLASAALRTQDAGVVVMAGLLYATTPIQVSYN